MTKTAQNQYHSKLGHMTQNNSHSEPKLAHPPFNQNRAFCSEWPPSFLQNEIPPPFVFSTYHPTTWSHCPLERLQQQQTKKNDSFKYFLLLQIMRRPTLMHRQLLMLTQDHNRDALVVLPQL